MKLLYTIFTVVVTVIGFNSSTLLAETLETKEELLIKCDDKNDADACLELTKIFMDADDDINTVKYSDKACKGDNMFGCGIQGYLYQDGIGVEQNYEKAIKLFEKSCNGNEIHACTTLSYMYQNGDGVDIDYNKVLHFNKKVCESDVIDPHDDKCNRFNNIYNSFQELRTKCDDGDTKICLELAEKYADKKDLINAFASVDTACNNNDTFACGIKGVLYQEGMGVKQDYKKAVKFFKQSCDEGEVKWCLALGAIYQQGLVADTKHENALRAYNKACNASKNTICSYFEELATDIGIDPEVQCNKYKYMYACGDIANKYLQNKDYSNAFKYLKIMCDADYMPGCSTQANLYKEGLGVKQNYKKARKFYTKSCDGGDLYACNLLGDMYAKGTEIDVDKALELYKKAYNSEDDTVKRISCDNFDQLYKKECSTDPKKFCSKYKK